MSTTASKAKSKGKKKEDVLLSLEEAIDKLREESVQNEGYLTGLFWSNNNQFLFFPENKLNSKMFFNKEYAFFFGLGRKMKDDGVQIFDELTVDKYIAQFNCKERYESYGGYDIIEEIIEQVKDYEENLDFYYREIKKYYMIKQLIDLFGTRVMQSTEKYDYKKLAKDELYTYWMDKLNKIGMDGDAKYEEGYLLQGLKTAIKEWSENPDIGLPFYKSHHMTKICTGWDYGHVYIYGGFGGSGKTSFTLNKVIMSCIEQKEKLLIIANEQSIKEFQKLLVVTALGLMGAEEKFKNKVAKQMSKKNDDDEEDNEGLNFYFKRQRLNEGNFDKDEIALLEKAVEWVENFVGTEENSDKLIAVVFMEDYVMDSVKKIIQYYANRGYRSVLIDTGKPSEGKQGQRWEIFTDDFKELYKIARPQSLNLRMWVNVQLADAALGRRFLNEHAFGESKKIKNEASVVFMGRFCWDDEFEGGSSEVEAWKWILLKDYKEKFKNDSFGDDPEMAGYEVVNGYVKYTFKLKKGGQYFFVFTPKNRRGQDNKTGQYVLVMKNNMNSNEWIEIGWCVIQDDRAY